MNCYTEYRSANAGSHLLDGGAVGILPCVRPKGIGGHLEIRKTKMKVEESMAKLLMVFLLLAFAAFGQALGSESAEADGQKWTLVNGVLCDSNGVFNMSGGAKVDGKPVFSLALLDQFETIDGSVSFEIKSVVRNVRGNNYHGLVFRSVDDLNYDVVYLRWRKNDDKLKGIQYVRINHGEEDFKRYDVTTPPPQRIYSVERKFDDETWIKVRVDFRGQDLKVFIADETEPAFHCEKLEPARKGRIGVWSYSSSGKAQIRNVKINKGKE